MRPSPLRLTLMCAVMLLTACKHAPPGGTYFFTVNLLERRRRLLGSYR